VGRSSSAGCERDDCRQQAASTSTTIVILVVVIIPTAEIGRADLQGSGGRQCGGGRWQPLAAVIGCILPADAETTVNRRQ